MIGDIAGGVSAAHPGTRVAALVVDAGLVARTLRIDRTLGLTLNVRVADIVADARAGGGLVALRAHGIDAAGAGVAGTDYFYGSCSG